MLGYLLTFMAGGTVGAVVMALLNAASGEEPHHRMEMEAEG